MLDHIKKHRAEIGKTFSVESDPIVKGGQGSGRKSIGYTNSGKQVWEPRGPGAQLDEDYTSQDHRDAAKLHNEHADRYQKRNDSHSELMEKRHKSVAKYHTEKISKDDDKEYNSLKKSEYSNLDIIKSSKSDINKQIADTFEKGGEGSKGGKIIGHTQSGKPIYNHQYAAKRSADHNSVLYAHQYSKDGGLKEFSKQDHLDAADKHREMYGKKKGTNAGDAHLDAAFLHEYHAAKAENWSSGEKEAKISKHLEAAKKAGEDSSYKYIKDPLEYHHEMVAKIHQN